MPWIIIFYHKRKEKKKKKLLCVWLMSSMNKWLIVIYIQDSKESKHLNNWNAELIRPKTLKVTYIARFSRNHRWNFSLKLPPNAIWSRYFHISLSLVVFFQHHLQFFSFTSDWFFSHATRLKSLLFLVLDLSETEIWVDKEGRVM